MSEESSDVFPYEIRHEVVKDFIRKYMEGAIKYKTPTEDSKEIALQEIKKISEYVSNYCSGQYRGKELGQLEQQIFSKLALLRGFDLIQETKVNIPEIEQRIGQLESSIASTNRLLLQVLDVLQQLLRRRSS